MAMTNNNKNLKSNWDGYKKTLLLLKSKKVYRSISNSIIYKKKLKLSKHLVFEKIKSWIDGWVDGIAVLRIAYNIIKCIWWMLMERKPRLFIDPKASLSLICIVCEIVF